MNPFDSEEGQGPIEGFFANMRKENQLREELDKMNEESSMKVENAVLMDLWKNLGDKTETYWQALNAAHDLIKALKAVRKAILNDDVKVSVILLKALSTLLMHDATEIERIQLHMQKLQHGQEPKSHSGE